MEPGELLYVGPIGQTGQLGGFGDDPIAVILGGALEGEVLIARCSTSAQAATDGETNLHNLTGLPFLKIAEVTRQDDTGGFRPGVTHSLWYCVLGADLDPGEIIYLAQTGSFAAIAVDRYDKGGPEAEFALVGYQVEDGSSGSAAVTLELGGVGAYSWLASIGYDSEPFADEDNPPPVQPWQYDRYPFHNAGNNLSGMTVLGMLRWNVGDEMAFELGPLTSARWGAILAAVEVTLAASDPDPPVAGQRQFQAQFETGTMDLDRVSLTRRPDAISRDYLRAWAVGPVDIGNQDEWTQGYLWRATYDVITGEITLERNEGGGWDHARVVTTIGQVLEIDLAFTFTAGLVLVAERATGEGGSSEVWLFDATWQLIGPGRTPRCCLDNFDPEGPRCTPLPHVQMVYLRTNVGMVRRSSEDGYSEDFPSPVPYSPNYYIERFYPSTARRMVAVLSVRDPVRGTYQLRRVDSLPYPEGLGRPHFNPNSVGDITWTRGQLWFNPAESSTTEELTLAVSRDPVDGQPTDVIELQCANEYPNGFQDDPPAPNVPVGIWTEQCQETAGNGFAVNVHHGAGFCEPCAYRIRARRILEDDTVCHSPWRYFLIAPMGPPQTPDSALIMCDKMLAFDKHNALECAFDQLGTINVLGRYLLEVSQWSLPTSWCPEGPEPGIFSCEEVIAGWSPGIAHLYRIDFSWVLYGKAPAGPGPLAWTDPAAEFVATLISDAITGGGGGNGGPRLTNRQSPLQLPATGS